MLPELFATSPARPPARPTTEIIFVDDGSRDHSPRRARPLGRRRPPRRRGPSLSQLRPPGGRAGRPGPQPRRRRCADGFRFARRAPRPSADFIAKWLAGYDVVYAIRTERQDRPLKRLFVRRFPLAHVAGGHGADPGRCRHFRPDRPPRRPADHRLGRKRSLFSGLRGWVGLQERACCVGATPATTNGRASRSPACSDWPRRRCFPSRRCRCRSST